MKNLVLALALSLSLSLSLSLLGAAQQGALSQEGKMLQSTDQKKIVHDPKEFKAYIDATHLKDAAARGAAMEAFADHYPKSVVYADALQEGMAAYQAAGNREKVVLLAERLLAFDPQNIQALAILTFIKMNEATPKAVIEARNYAERGLKLMAGWKALPGMSKAEFAAMRNQTEAIFYGAIGLAGLYTKDYAKARAALLKTVGIPHPANFVDPYRLAVAELESTPPDAQGFWYIAKAIDEAKKQNPPAAEQIEAYATAKYQRYHGTLDGWDALLASAATEKAPPKQFNVTAAPAK